MPTYEYICDYCGNRFESFRPISSPDGQCPRCGKPARRLISAGGGLLFKGSGFFITDYRSKAYKEQAKKEAETAGKEKS